MCLTGFFNSSNYQNSWHAFIIHTQEHTHTLSVCLSIYLSNLYMIDRLTYTGSTQSQGLFAEISVYPDICVWMPWCHPNQLPHTDCISLSCPQTAPPSHFPLSLVGILVFPIIQTHNLKPRHNPSITKYC